jgi:sulfate permease, SulP family
VDGAPKPVHHVIVDASSISDIDASGQVALREVVGGLRERNISLSVARATVELRLQLDRVGLTEAIGPGNFHGTVAAADACDPPTGTSP